MFKAYMFIQQWIRQALLIPSLDDFFSKQKSRNVKKSGMRKAAQLNIIPFFFLFLFNERFLWLKRHNFKMGRLFETSN